MLTDSLYNFDSGMVDMVTNENMLTSISKTSTSMTLSRCASECSLVSSCVSFFLHLTFGICQLHGIISGKSMLCEPGWMRYKRNRIPTSCADASTCGANQDGTYWINPHAYALYDAMMIYCSNMKSSPIEYVTLQEDNYVEEKRCLAYCDPQPPDRFMFHKIGINLTNMTIRRDDFLFSESTSVLYGNVVDCNGAAWDTCVRATMTIDLSNTGFIVHPDTVWRATGYQAGIIEIIRDPEDTTVYVECGGRGGDCAPENDQIQLVHTGIYDPAQEDATLMFC